MTLPRLLLLSVIFALPSAGTFAADICGDLDSLIATDSDFSSLRGAKSGDGAWKSTLTVTGFDSCTVSTYKDKLIFNCLKESDSRDVMLVDLGKLADATWACPHVTSRNYDEYKDLSYQIGWGFFIGDSEQAQMAGMADMFNDGKFQVELTMFETD
ncbi:MAG TPA: hypothetical protein VHZ56_03525 [Devosia sp.]|jgi:hypothetical protein|nr:hypothetical protein [Devosia sp.]